MSMFNMNVNNSYLGQMLNISKNGTGEKVEKGLHVVAKAATVIGLAGSVVSAAVKFGYSYMGATGILGSIASFIANTSVAAFISLHLSAFVGVSLALATVGGLFWILTKSQPTEEEKMRKLITEQVNNLNTKIENLNKKSNDSTDDTVKEALAKILDEANKAKNSLDEALKNNSLSLDNANELIEAAKKAEEALDKALNTTMKK